MGHFRLKGMIIISQDFSHGILVGFVARTLFEPWEHQMFRGLGHCSSPPNHVTSVLTPNPSFSTSVWYCAGVRIGSCSLWLLNIVRHNCYQHCLWFKVLPSTCFKGESNHNVGDFIEISVSTGGSKVAFGLMPVCLTPTEFMKRQKYPQITQLFSKWFASAMNHWCHATQNKRTLNVPTPDKVACLPGNKTSQMFCQLDSTELNHSTPVEYTKIGAYAIIRNKQEMDEISDGLIKRITYGLRSLESEFSHPTAQV